MVVGAVIAIGSVLAFALSPPSLIVLGNLVGSTGYGFLVFISLATALHCLTALTYAVAARQFPGPAGEAKLIGSWCGELTGIAMPIAARWPLAVVGSTSLLVTAGYTFNEVFVRWFPNLGFSFLLLACLALINFSSERVWFFFQAAFLAVATLGFLAVAIGGALVSAAPIADSPAVTVDQSTLPIALVVFFIFVGFDLAAYLTDASPPPTRYWIAGLILAALCLSFWGVLSARHVAAQRLMESSLPHMLAARTLLGEFGRQLMGAAAIGATCAAVSMLLRGTTQLTVRVAAFTLPGQRLAASRWGRRLPTVLLVGLIASMFASGMGGEPILDVWIAASLWLWIAHHGVLHAALAARCRALNIGCAHAYIALMIIGTVLLGTMIWSSDFHRQGIFMAAVALAACCLGYLCLAKHRR